MSDVETMKEKRQSSKKRSRGLAVKCEQLFRIFRDEITLIITPSSSNPDTNAPFAYFSNPDHVMVSQMKKEYPQSTILLPDSFEYVTDDEADRGVRSRDTPRRIRIRSNVNPRRRSPLKSVDSGPGRDSDGTPTKKSSEGLRRFPQRPQRPQRPRPADKPSTRDGLPHMPPRPERPRRIRAKSPRSFADLPPRPRRLKLEVASTSGAVG